MIKGYTYVNLSLFPVYINDSHKSSLGLIGVQRYNSPKWISAVNNQDLDNLHKIVRLSEEDGEEDPSNNYYPNFQLITDLFDIILTKQSDFRNPEINEEVDYLLRKKEYLVDLSTDSRYVAEFLVFHPQNNAIILLTNPPSRNCRTLIKKRQKLNEYL